MLRRCFSISVQVMLLAVSSVSLAQWSPDGTPFRTWDTILFRGSLVPDATGGAFVFSRDDKVSIDRIDGWGTPVWPTSVVLGESGGDWTINAVCEDGNGGAYVCFGSSTLYVQRIAPDGTKLFPEPGLVIDPSISVGSSMVRDGTDGVLVFWSNGGEDDDIHGQRVTSSGEFAWGPDGVVVCGEINHQRVPVAIAVPDGAYVVWFDQRNESSSGADLYAQRVMDDGSRAWDPGGLPICSASTLRRDLTLAADPLGGVVVVWSDYRDGFDGDIYGQHLDPDGAIGWPHDGLRIGYGDFEQFTPQVECSDDGKAYVVWTSSTHQGHLSLVMQQIERTGDVALSGGWFINHESTIRYWSMVSDGYGGVVLAWQELLGSGYRAMGQRYVGMETQWGPEPLQIGNPETDRWEPTVIADGHGGFIVSFAQLEDKTARAVRMGPFGHSGFPAAMITSVTDVPDDNGGWVRVAIRGSDLDVDPRGLAVLGYNVWRRLPDDAITESSVPEVAMLLAGVADGLKIGPPAAKALSMPEGNWESIGFHAAIGQDAYLFLSPTRTDSTAAGAAAEVFCVTTHLDVDRMTYASLPVGGSSLDNLVPAPPENVNGVVHREEGGVTLSWDASAETEDLAGYRVYRVDGPDRPLDDQYRIGTTIETWFVDPTRPEPNTIYKITAYDRRENESEAAVLAAEGISGTGPPEVLRNHLAQNHPNPFNPQTDIVYELKNTGAVSLRIHDLSGRLVQTLIAGEVIERGVCRATWHGTDDAGRPVAAGVYVYRLETSGFTATRRMALIR